MLGQPKLALERIKTIELPLPPLPEQQAIAATLDGVDATLEKAYRERDGLGLLKESTADALLTGRVRVGKLMNEQDSMSDLSEATLWDARQVTARRFESIAALNQPVFPPGLMKSIAVLNRPVFPPGLMKSIAVLNRPVFPPGLMKSIAVLNRPAGIPPRADEVHRRLEPAGGNSSYGRVRRRLGCESITQRSNGRKPGT